MDKETIHAVHQNNRLLRAVLALMVKNYDETGERIELLLAGCGLGYQEIAMVVNKKPDAVRMLLKRNKQQKTNK